MLRVTWPGHVESICVTVIALSLLVKKFSLKWPLMWDDKSFSLKASYGTRQTVHIIFTVGECYCAC